MSAITIAKRYGRAVVELAVESDAMDGLESDVKMLEGAIRGVPEFIRGLSDERVEPKKREGATRKICMSLGLGEIMTNLLLLLVMRGRAQLLQSILGDIALRIASHKNYMRVDVTVADAILSDDIRRRLERELGSMLGINVECAITEDKSLLGGFVINVGNEQFDASVANKLERMKERLLRGM